MTKVRATDKKLRTHTLQIRLRPAEKKLLQQATPFEELSTWARRILIEQALRATNREERP